jgi:trk system potassium uptake protein TrkA
VAHLVSGKLIDYIEFDDGFAIAKMRAPLETQGFTLTQSKVRQKYGVTVVGVKSPGRDFTYAQADTRVSAHDLLIVSGATALVERFAARP